MRPYLSSGCLQSPDCPMQINHCIGSRQRHQYFRCCLLKKAACSRKEYSYQYQESSSRGNKQPSSYLDALLYYFEMSSQRGRKIYSYLPWSSQIEIPPQKPFNMHYSNWENYRNEREEEERGGMFDWCFVHCVTSLSLEKAQDEWMCQEIGAVYWFSKQTPKETRQTVCISACL